MFFISRFTPADKRAMQIDVCIQGHKKHIFQ